VREPERQAAGGERIGRRHEAPHDGVTALAVEDFTRFQISFCQGDGIGPPSCGAAGRLAAQAD
jgi:hypothetical protein